MVVATDRETLLAETKAYEYAERRIENWAFENRRQQQQVADFMATIQRIRSTNTSDGAAAAVFHGQRQMSRKERIQRWHNEQIQLSLRRKVRKHALALRRGSGEVFRCKHCNLITRGDATKCKRCKNDPRLVTARGTETRSFVPRREAQPSIIPLSADARRIDALLEELPEWMASAIERRYLRKESDHNAAEALMISVSTFAGRARAAVARVAELLANDEREPV